MMGKYLSGSQNQKSLPKALSRALDIGVIPLYKTGVTLRSSMRNMSWERKGP